jgi:hypothetical protein
VALVGLFGGTAQWYFGGAREVTPANLVADTQVWLDDVDFANRAAWRSVNVQAPPYPFPADFVAASPAAWRRIDTGLDRRAVAFKVSARGRQAYLFVIGGTAKPIGIGGVPPAAPFPGATGGWKIGAWTTGGFLYVLAVEGDQKDYRSLLRSRATA